MNKRYFLSTFLLTMALCLSAAKPSGRVWVFGVATVLNDSVVYMTDIQQLDSASIYGKGKFLYSRNNYSYQLRDHLEKAGIANAMCVTTFATSQKDIEKKYLALRKRLSKKPHQKASNRREPEITIKYIEKNDFRYQCIKPDEE